MQVVLLQILLWILRIILFLLLLMILLITIIMIVPIRYRVEGEFREKKPGIRGKITWFFYLIHMKFAYEEEFHIIVRVFGIKVYDSLGESKSFKKIKKDSKKAQEKTSNSDIVKEETLGNSDSGIGSQEVEVHSLEVDKNQEIISDTEDELAVWEREVEALEKEEAELASKVIHEQKTVENNIENKKISSDNKKNKKSLEEKIEDVKTKIINIVEKVKEIWEKIQNGKLKVEHYLELWNRKETQITFQRAKRKFGKVIKAILPRKWNINGNIGFADPSTTGKLLGVLGAMYPILGNHIQIIPDFENEVLEIEGKAKGHIRLGNLTYQLISLLLNRYCFKFIKLIFDELGGSKKKKKET